MIMTQKRVLTNMLLNVVSVRHEKFIFLLWKFGSVALKHWRRLLIVTIINSHTEEKEARMSNYSVRTLKVVLLYFNVY